jgi:Ca2+/Na+ antiporter
LRFTASDVSLFFFIFHLTIVLSVIYSFWCMSVLFHFSFDHCIVCDLQLLMYMVIWKMKKNTDTSEAVNHRQYNGQMKNEKEQWYIRSCKSQTIQWSNEKWKRTMIHEKLLWFTASDVWVFSFIFHLTIALSVIYSFWCMSVLFHFSFDHCIVCDLQLLMYQCSFSFFIWPLQMKNEKEHSYIRSCKS